MEIDPADPVLYEYPSVFGPDVASHPTTGHRLGSLSVRFEDRGGVTFIDLFDGPITVQPAIGISFLAGGQILLSNWRQSGGWTDEVALPPWDY